LPITPIRCQTLKELTMIGEQLHPQHHSPSLGTGLTTITSPTKDLSYEHDRWATMRGLNVEAIGSLWKENPNRVRVIDDPRLGDEQLVVLSKKNFEMMLNFISDLESGNIGVGGDIETIGEHFALIQKLLEEKCKSVDKEELEPVMMAVQLTSKVLTKTKTHFLVVSDSKAPQSPTLTQEDMDLLDYDK
jgi:hypothetical protein